MSSTTRTQNYPWRQVAPGSYIQNYDSWQSVQVSWNILDKEGRRLHLLATYVKIESNFSDLEYRLRKAWIAVRYHHPGVAVQLGEYYKTYNVPTEEDLEAWLSSTFLFPACDTAEEFQKRHLNTDSHPQLHWFPKTQELLLVAHHTLFDATGLWLFWQSFLDLVVKPEEVRFGDEWKNLPLTRDDLLNLPKYPSLAGNAKGLAVITDASKEDAIELPILNAKVDPDGHVIPDGQSRNEFLRLTLPSDQTRAIVQSCKHRGVSISAAFFTALATSCRKIQGEQVRAGRYAIGFHNFDSRAWFPREYGLICNAGGDPHTMIPFALDLEGQEFDQILAVADGKFKAIRADFSKDHTGLDAISHMLKGLLDLDGPIATFPGFTSFGVAEKLIKTTYRDETGGWVQIQDTYHWIHNMVKGVNAVSLHTWNGQMYLGGCFNGAYHSKGMFRRLFQDTLDLVVAKFGAKLPEHL